MWEIDKEFNFEMGHRVWSQKLNYTHLSLNNNCACKHLHGHSYKVKICLKSNKLNSSGMVTDFKNLNFFKQFVDNVFDHRFMIDINDPNFELITGISSKDLKDEFFTPNKKSIISDNDILCQNDHVKSFVVTNFIPTSENICEFIFHHVSDYIQDVAEVSAVELWETAKSHCVYRK